MESKDYAIILLIIILIAVVSFSLAYIWTSQPKTSGNNNSLNSSNDTNVSTINSSTNKSQVQNQTKQQYITEQQAINIYKKETADHSNKYRYVATLFFIEGKPYYSITFIDKKTGDSSTSPGAVNAITGELEGPD